MHLIRRADLLVIGLFLFGFTSSTAASEPRIPLAENLQRDSAETMHGNRVLLLMVSQTGCAYCEILKTEIIGPLLRSGDYTDRLIIRELFIDPGVSVHDFDGQPVMGADFARRYNAWVTPTLLFLDPQGKELVQSIRGINGVDFFWYYLDRAIADALQRLRG